MKLVRWKEKKRKKIFDSWWLKESIIFFLVYNDYYYAVVSIIARTVRYTSISSTYAVSPYHDEYFPMWIFSHIPVRYNSLKLLEIKIKFLNYCTELMSLLRISRTPLLSTGKTSNHRYFKPFLTLVALLFFLLVSLISYFFALFLFASLIMKISVRFIRSDQIKDKDTCDMMRKISTYVILHCKY